MPGLAARGQVGAHCGALWLLLPYASAVGPVGSWTNPLAMSLGSNRSGRHVQQGLKHDLINLLVLQIFILSQEAAHTKHRSGRGLYLR